MSKVGVVERFQSEKWVYQKPPYIVKTRLYHMASYDKPRPPTSSLLNKSLVWNILRLFQYPLVMTTLDQLTLQTSDPSQASFSVSLAFLSKSLESSIALNPSLRLFLMSIYPPVQEKAVLSRNKIRDMGRSHPCVSGITTLMLNTRRVPWGCPGRKSDDHIG